MTPTDQAGQPAATACANRHEGDVDGNGTTDLLIQHVVTKGAHMIIASDFVL